VTTIGNVAATAVAAPVTVLEQPMRAKKRPVDETLQGDLKPQQLTQ
jgi:hypothetical protein